jgi:trehalose 6-phosphate synthase/phosphatase
MNNLIVVSNRLPFNLEKRDGRIEVRQSSGGLVSSLNTMTQDGAKIRWIGIADFKQELWKENKDIISTTPYDVDPIFSPKKMYELYYDDFSNGVLWPLFHYFPSYAVFNDDAFEAFKAVNRLFADKIIGLAKRGDKVWIHDYHLMLLPGYLKEKRPDLQIGFFLHIPFPSYEILKLIPNNWRQELLNGIMQADVTGFHTNEYVKHFKRSIAYFAGYDMHRDVTHPKTHNRIIKAYPISVDYEKFNSAFYQAPVVKGRKIIKEKYRDYKIIFSVDRLDYTKGVINRLEAYELLLQNHPKLREKIVFVINVVPSRDQINKYAERKKMIEENIGRINGLYANMHWQPVIYQYRHLTFSQLLSFYTSADIALVTPLRDGMNLVAKEYVAARADKKGVLILSEFAGAAAELKGAIMVNPNDVTTLKDGIITALQLNEHEQCERMEGMQKVLRENNIHKWTGTFLSDLTQVKEMNILNQPHLMTFDERREITEGYINSSKRLLLLDYDGTLAPYYIKPADAKPSEQLKTLLRNLVSNQQNEVIIISGRDAPTLEKWFGDTGVSIVAEHGALFKRYGHNWITFAGNCELWKSDVSEVFEKYVLQFKGAFIEQKTHSVALHYRTVDKDLVEKLKTEVIKELLMLDLNYEFHVIQGNMVIEVKGIGIDKGSFARGIINENNYEFILAIGDDATDEDMFDTLYENKNAFTVKVGITPTKARCNLINVNNVISFLEQLNNCKPNYARPQSA